MEPDDRPGSRLRSELKLAELYAIAAAKQLPWWRRLARKITDLRGHESSEAMTEIMRIF
ncbi:MAG: hypothetical protein F6K35_28615 [Okeania sp. SIO2H7]|nr:hypothetical protein [Okeania sp. SIO2H7]